MMSDPIYTQQLTSPEEFFVRKFDGNSNLTSKKLRMEEAELESKLLSKREPESQFRIQKFQRIRDYLTLCRGGALVIIYVLYFSYFRSSISFEFGHSCRKMFDFILNLNLQKFQNDGSSKKSHGKEKCILTHQDDPFLFLMPLKLEVIMAGHLSLYVFHSVFNSQRIDEIQEYIDLMVRKYLIQIMIYITSYIQRLF